MAFRTRLLICQCRTVRRPVRKKHWMKQGAPTSLETRPFPSLTSRHVVFLCGVLWTRLSLVTSWSYNRKASWTARWASCVVRCKPQTEIISDDIILELMLSFLSKKGKLTLRNNSYFFGYWLDQGYPASAHMRATSYAKPRSRATLLSTHTELRKDI